MGLDFSIAKLRAVSLGNPHYQDDYLGKVSSAELDIKSIDQLQFNARFIDDKPINSLIFFQRLSSILLSKRFAIQQRQRKIKEQYRQKWRAWKQCINQASFCQLKETQLRRKSHESLIQYIPLSEKYQDLAEKNNTEAIQLKQTADKLIKEYKKLAQKAKQIGEKRMKLKTQASNLLRTLQYIKAENDFLYLHLQTLESDNNQFQCEQFSSNQSRNQIWQQGKFPYKEVAEFTSLFSDQEQSSLFQFSGDESSRPKDLKFD